MFKLHHKKYVDPIALLTSELYDQDNFYPAFLADLQSAQKQVVIESPFITTRRMNVLLPVFRELSIRGVRIVINTRNPEEHDPIYQYQAEEAVEELQNLGVMVLYTVKHHRKVAVIDGQIVWEGSLNLLSHSNSSEIMRRMYSEQLATQMINFLNIEKLLDWERI